MGTMLDNKSIRGNIINSKEIINAKYVSIQELKEMIKNGETFE